MSARITAAKGKSITKTTLDVTDCFEIKGKAGYNEVHEYEIERADVWSEKVFW